MDFMGDGASSKARSDDDDTVGASKGSRHGRRRRRVATGVFAGIVVASAVVGVAVRVSKSSTAGTLVTGPSGASCDFKVNGDCQGMNLNGVVVRGVDLTGMKFNRSSLNGADFTGSTFTNTDLTDATFIGAILDGVKSGGVIGKKSLKTSFPSYLIDPAKYVYNSWSLVNYRQPFRSATEWLATGQYGYFINRWSHTKRTYIPGWGCYVRALCDVYNSVPFVSDGRKEWLPPAWQLVGGYLVGPKANLAGAQFGSSDLSYQNLSFSNLEGADMSNAVLYFTNLSGANAKGAIGNPIYWQSRNLTESMPAWQQEKVSTCDWEYTPFDAADDFAYAAYIYCTTGETVDPILASIGRNIANDIANSIRVDLFWCNPATDPHGCNPTFVNGYMVLPGANLIGANLNPTSGNGCCYGLDMQWALLGNADMRYANLNNANLRGAKMGGTRLAGVGWWHTTCPNGQVNVDLLPCSASQMIATTTTTTTTTIPPTTTTTVPPTWTTPPRCTKLLC